MLHQPLVMASATALHHEAKTVIIQCHLHQLHVYQTGTCILCNSVKQEVKGTPTTGSMLFTLDRSQYDRHLCSTHVVGGSKKDLGGCKVYGHTENHILK